MMIQYTARALNIPNSDNIVASFMRIHKHESKTAVSKPEKSISYSAYEPKVSFIPKEIAPVAAAEPLNRKPW